VTDSARGEEEAPHGRTSASHPASSSTPDEVIRKTFDEAPRRDTDRRRRWVALVDGDGDQIAAIRVVAKTTTLVLDLMHAREYGKSLVQRVPHPFRYPVDKYLCYPVHNPYTVWSGTRRFCYEESNARVASVLRYC
jgi:hypothetical protein